MKYISQKYSKGNVLKERERERTKFPCLLNVLKTQNLNLEIDVSAVIVLTRNWAKEIILWNKLLNFVDSLNNFKMATHTEIES